MKWCKHLLGTALEPDNYSFVYDSQTLLVPKYWNICPICGTPKPKEKSLEEKLRERLFGFIIDGVIIERDKRYPLIDSLAEIAENHFKSNSGKVEG